MSTKFDQRDDPSVVRNYGALMIELAGTVPDGVVCFFTRYVCVCVYVQQQWLFVLRGWQFILATTYSPVLSSSSSSFRWCLLTVS